MKFRDLQADLARLSKAAKYVFAVILIALASFSTFAYIPQNLSTDEARELIKRAAKLSRDGALVEAESLLRQAAEMDPARSDAKIELAYVLVKEHRPLDAYNICMPIAKDEPQNARVFAVIGSMLLSGGRF